MTATTRKPAAEWPLGDVLHDKVFWRHHRGAVRNLDELASALREMSEGEFRRHAVKDKNDCGNWIRDVMGRCDAGQAAREECYTHDSCPQGGDETQLAQGQAVGAFH